MSKLNLALTIVKNDTLPHVDASSGLQKILTVFFVILGAISLLMLVIAGFRYTISAGDAERTATARRMIIYTAVGLIVSALAVTIVNTILGKVST